MSDGADGLGPLPKVNERQLIVSKASVEFTSHFLTLVERYKLTTAEQLFVLTDEMNSIIRYAVKAERNRKKRK